MSIVDIESDEINSEVLGQLGFKVDYNGADGYRFIKQILPDDPDKFSLDYPYMTIVVQRNYCEGDYYFGRWYMWASPCSIPRWISTYPVLRHGYISGGKAEIIAYIEYIKELVNGKHNG
jgi:hypothetical protein